MTTFYQKGVFAPLHNARCLYTTIRNISEKTLFFGFLPPHGKKLAPGEEIVIPGDIQSYFNRQTHHGRHQRSFENALAGDSPVIALEETPSVHLFDSVLDRTKILDLANGSLIARDPCWGSYTSAFIS